MQACMNEWKKEWCENKKVPGCCNMDYTSMMGGGRFNEESDYADTESLIFIACLLCAKCFNTSGQSSWRQQKYTEHETRAGPVGPSGWQIILKCSQPNCGRKACNVLHTMDRAIWGFNLPTLSSPSTSMSNPSGVRFLWLWGFCSDRWALNIVGIYLPPSPVLTNSR